MGFFGLGRKGASEDIYSLQIEEGKKKKKKKSIQWTKTEKSELRYIVWGNDSKDYSTHMKTKTKTKTKS